MTTNLRYWFVYKYQYNDMKEPAIAVRAIGKNRTLTLDSLPPTVIDMITVQAKSKSEAYRLGVRKGGFLNNMWAV